MTTRDTNNRNLPPDINEGAGVVFLFFGTLALVIFFVSSAVAVFGASLAAGVAIVAVVVTTAILGAAFYHKQQRLSLTLVLLGLTALWAALGGYIVFENHWLAFTPTAWVLNGLYVAALVSCDWSAINKWLKIIAALLAVSLVTATVFLPRPPNGDGPLDTAEEWRINIDVKDENGEPLQGALVLCGAVMRRETTLALAETFARQTDREGRITAWEFNEDPRLKIVICNAWKNADDGNAGYPQVSQFIFSPTNGGEYELHFTLVENPHPNTAFLTFDLSGDYEQAWYTLKFELWAGEPVSYFGARDGAQPLQRKDWDKSRGAAFTVTASQAAHDLYLRYFYEGPDGAGLVPPYHEMRTIHIGASKHGLRKRLALRIPNK